MSATKFSGIPLSIIMWILLAISVGFAWAYFNLLNQVKNDFSGDTGRIVDNAWSSMLTAAVLSTVALTALTIQVIFYTVQFRNMGAMSASLFFLEWILIAISTIVYWLISNPTTVKDNYLLVGAITSTVALFLFTVYFGMEIYPFFQEKLKSAKKNQLSRK